MSKLYKSIPSCLALNKKRFILSNALGKRTTNKDKQLLYDLLDSKTILISNNVSDPSIALEQTKNIEVYINVI